MGKISYDEDGGGGGRRRDSRDSDRRRGRHDQSRHFGGRNHHYGDSRGRSNVSNNNRGSEDLRSRLGKKSTVEKTVKQSSVGKRDKPVKTTPVKLNHIEEEEKKEEDLELRQMKVRKLNPNAFALSSIVRKQASENTKVKQVSTKSTALDEDPDVRIVNSNVRDKGKKFGKTVKNQDGAIRIANDDQEFERKPIERKIKFRPESPVKEAVERSRSPSSSTEDSSSDSGHSDHKKHRRKKKKHSRKVEERKRKKHSSGATLQADQLVQALSSKQIKRIMSDPSFTKEDLQALGLSPDKKKKRKSKIPSPVKSSSASNSDSNSSSSSSSSDSSDSEDEKADDTSSIQSCEPEINNDVRRADASREPRGGDLSIDEELALNKARLKALDSPKSPNESARKSKSEIVEEHEFYVKSKETTKMCRDVLTPRGDERGASRSVNIQEKKETGDRSRILNDEEAKKQRLFNRLQKSKSTSDIKSRLGNKMDKDSQNNFGLNLDKEPPFNSGKKRSSPSDHLSDRSKRRRSDHVNSRERSSERKRESYDRRTRSPYDRRTRSPYGRRTRSPFGKRSRSPYHRERSYDRRERSPRRYQRSRSRDDKTLSKLTTGGSDDLVDWYLGFEKRVKQETEMIKVRSKSEFYCCDFCGIAKHFFANCTEDEPRGKNSKDVLGKKEMCLQCGSFSHLRQDCVHTQEKGSNGIGVDGKKFQCSHCLSYDHLTQKCGKIHSEKLGKNPLGIGGKKISCELCNSFHHMTADHGAASKLVTSCDHCGEFSHSSQNCHNVKERSSFKLGNGAEPVFRWCLLSKEVGNTPCSWCRASHHSSDTCPNKHSREYGRNPSSFHGEMASCSICGSFSHLDASCFHSEINGKNPISGGKKLQCIYCKSYSHVVGCTEHHNERFGMNPRNASGMKMRCEECGSYSHLSEKCPHTKRFGSSQRRCIYCGSFNHRNESDCYAENNMVRDYLRWKLGYDNMSLGALIARNKGNKWADMQTISKSTSTFVEEISAEEIQMQKDNEKSLLERLRMKSDPNYVPESNSTVSKESSPGAASLSKSDSMTLGSSGEPENIVYNEPDESIFAKIDLRTNPEEQPEINEQLQNVIVSALTGDKDDKVVSSFKIHITRTDLFGLTGENWINDKIVEMYMQMVARRSVTNRCFKNLKKPRIYCMSTFFFLNLIMRGAEAVSKWTKDVDIFSFDVILIPIHLEMHWCVATVDFRAPGVFYYDSMGGHNMPALSAILEYLRQEHIKKKGVELDLTKFAKEIADCPQQQNGADCGIFACKVADFISREVPVNEFSQEDMPYYRKRMIWEIVKQQLLAP